VAAEGQLDIADGPAALLPNGNVLVASSPGIYKSAVHFLEFDGTNLAEVARTPNAPNVSSYAERFLLLPTGQVLETDGSANVQLYQPRGGASASWAPTIATVPANATRGSTYQVTGTQFNGLSQAVAYGDDAQSATNYPLVRITNNATGHVFYARTHGHSTMAVATGSETVSTSFDVPSSAETGASQIVVVANGIASSPLPITLH
jgi:hypothetical protein